MSSSGYGSIPGNDGNDDSNPAGSWNVFGINFSMASVLSLLATFAVGLGVGGIFLQGKTPEPSPSPTNIYWPNYLVSQAAFHTKRPTNTTEATALGWQPSGEPCVPSLGEPWLFGGVRSADKSVTIYFTPAVSDDEPGIVSAIEVDYYGYLEETLIGSYFTPQRTSPDGATYHSLAVAFRNAAQHDLCDSVTTTALAGNPEKYIAIAPDMANKLVPIHEDLPELTTKWKLGSCIPNMGRHWEQDVVGGTNLSYKAENLVPIVPMYNSFDGTINGIFFTATERKQVWPIPVCLVPNATMEQLGSCFAQSNFWDPGPGLSQENKGRFYMCSNFCDEQCSFTGSADGIYNTMHWFFMDPTTDQCQGTDRGPAPYCSDGNYPIMSR